MAVKAIVHRMLSAINPRLVSMRLLVVGIVCTLLLVGYTYTSSPSSRFPSLPLPGGSECTPSAYASGSWEYKPRTNKTTMTNTDDALEFAGFEGCASSREFYWHLAADNEEQWDRFPGVSSWEWVTGDDCDTRPLNREELVKDLVERGGWLLLGGMSTLSTYITYSYKLYFLI